MSEEKKYTAQEAAVAVLNKTKELLEKSELAKKEKGVHAPSFNPKGGHSQAGYHAEAYKESGIKGHKEAAKQLHSEKLGELKDMPKPNLPKSEEMDKKESGYEKGVHTKAYSTAGSEESDVGHALKTMPSFAKQPKTSFGQKIKDAPKEAHKKKLKELKEMPKPNLPKSEKMTKVEEQEVKEKEGVQEQTPPDMNPKEQAENNNPEWGTSPKSYSTLKLAKFMGYIEAKRKQKKGI